MSGQRRPREPVFRAKAHPGGWWCCGVPMVTGDLPELGEIRLCRRCGALVQLSPAGGVLTCQLGHPARRRGARPHPHQNDAAWQQAEEHSRAFALALFPLLAQDGGT